MTMWRQILGMSIFISSIMVFMFFFIDNMWDLPYADTDDWINLDGTPSNKCKVFTMLFNTFIYLHLFNKINCRKVKGDQMNVFEHIHSNFYFISVFFGIALAQYAIVQWGGQMTRCAALDGEQFAFCVLIGSSSLVVSFLLKLLPEKWNDRLPKLIDEKKSNSNDRLIKFYKAQAEAKLSTNLTSKKAAAISA